ncbi:hypothetical protein CFC21_019965 [Triticum aestivum]|uniref:Uncharacterized protein n=2 Tax=Triticum aestivum TaxID=4565 RepID=A0A3B6B7F0_WHEAT|nr:hypothetical protein CFC21_019965 [Triticum aestivum]
MSNYMMHLFFENPEMLMPGSRKILLVRAYDELEDIIGSGETPKDDREFTQRLIEKCNAGGSRPDSFIHQAWLLVQSLLGDVGDETKMWEVIQGVWVEMLCFSAGRSRGYLHAEALGTGVEYLSYVWVLLTFYGMETFPDKLERREGLPAASEGRQDAAAATAFGSESEGSAHVVIQV